MGCFHQVCSTSSRKEIDFLSRVLILGAILRIFKHIVAMTVQISTFLYISIVLQCIVRTYFNTIELKFENYDLHLCYTSIVKLH